MKVEVWFRNDNL